MREKEGADETFEDFGSGAEKGDGTVGGAEVEGFTRFGYGDDEGVLPDGGEIGVGEREVEEGAEEGDAFGAQLPKVEIGKTVRTDGR